MCGVEWARARQVDPQVQLKGPFKLARPGWLIHLPRARVRTRARVRLGSYIILQFRFNTYWWSWG